MEVLDNAAALTRLLGEFDEKHERKDMLFVKYEL